MNAQYAEEFAQRLKNLRKDRGYTQYNLAEALNTPRQNIQGYETGGKFPKYEMLVQMCKLFGVSADYMLGLDSDTIPAENQSIFISQIRGLESTYKEVSRERQHTVDNMLKDIYVIMDAALKTSDDREIGLYIDLFDVARRIVDTTNNDA